MMDETYDTDLLAKLIERKRDVLSRLMTLIEKQWTIIEKEDYSQLLSVLAAKQPLLTELHSTEKGIEPFRSQDAESRVWRSQDDRLACRANAERCTELLTAVMNEEKRCEQYLVERREETKEMLDQTVVAGQAHRAYRSNQAQPTSQLNLLSQD